MKLNTKLKIPRIDTIDLLRGYFLFVILIDHFGRFFGFYEVFTGRGEQWVSAAEGFFFVSGIMVGLVRGRKLDDQPFSSVLKKLWSRAGQLYIWSVGLTILFSAVALWLGPESGVKAGIFQAGGLKEFTTQTLSLQFSYGWADFLRYYAVYLFVSPFAILALRKKHWPLILILSGAIWWYTIGLTGSFQILFFTGLVTGYYYPEIQSKFRELKPKSKKLLKLSLYSITSLTLLMSILFTTLGTELGSPPGPTTHFGIDFSSIRSFSKDTLNSYFDKQSLAFGRLVLFYIWFSAGFFIVKKYEAKLKQTVGKILIPFGQNSLYVYIVHAIIIFFANLILPHQASIFINFALNTALILLIWWMVKEKFLFKIIPR